MAVLRYQWLLLFCFLLQNFNGRSDNFSGQPTQKEPSHPFYIAVTEINHNAKDRTLEISCKMFADDLEQILEKNYKKALDISLDKDKPLFDQYIPDYIARHLTLVVDGKPVKPAYLGFEKEKESAFCYFQANDIPAPKKIGISNSILYDFNEGQINITHVTVNGSRQSIKLNYPEKDANFSF
jgi:hypothetical protein